MRLAGALGFALALVLIGGGASALHAQPAVCSFSQPFKALHDQLPEVVGYCVERERFNADNGNTEQRTTNGLLVWRKSDDRVLFTNGVTTWIVGPAGLLSRPSNGPLFPWEQVAAQSSRTTEAAAPGTPVAEPPPGLGSVVLEDALTSPGTFTSFRCPTGLGERSFPADGYLLSVSGRCQAVDSAAGVIGSALGLQVPDGDVRFEFRASGAVERVLVGARVRVQPNRADGYFVTIEPAGGRARLGKRAGGVDTPLAERNNLGGLLTVDGWNSVAIRLNGSHIWLLIGEQVVLEADDATFASGDRRGDVQVGLTRLGVVDDSTPVSVTLRSLSVSQLSPEAAARVPAYAPPSQVVPPGPPRVGRVYFSTDPDGNRRAETAQTIIKAGVPAVYAFYDYFDVTAPSTLNAYFLRSDSSDRITTDVQRVPFTPDNPTGWASIGLTNGRGLEEGKLTLVVELNGKEVACADVLLQ